MFNIIKSTMEIISIAIGRILLLILGKHFKNMYWYKRAIEPAY
jgi:hypothetical protein